MKIKKNIRGHVCPHVIAYFWFWIITNQKNVYVIHIFIGFQLEVFLTVLKTTDWLVLTRSCPSHNPELLSCFDDKIKPIKDDGCVLPVLHLIVPEGNSSFLWPALWNFHTLCMFGCLRVTTLSKTKWRRKCIHSSPLVPELKTKCTHWMPQI